MAERVGFVPGEPASINDLRPVSIPQITRNAQNLSIRYKTGTVRNALPLHPADTSARMETHSEHITLNPFAFFCHQCVQRLNHAPAEEGAVFSV
jgi:hypothetical protein